MNNLLIIFIKLPLSLLDEPSHPFYSLHYFWRIKREKQSILRKRKTYGIED